MKRFWMLCCCVLLSLALLLSACSPAVSFVEADTPSFPGLTWGMSKEEAFEALHITQADSCREGNLEIPVDIYTVNSYSIGRETVSLDLSFPSAQWMEEHSLNLGLIDVNLKCNQETASHIVDQFTSGKYTEDLTIMPIYEKGWNGPNAYQVFTEKGIWNIAEDFLITIYDVEDENISESFALDTPEKVVQYGAEEHSLSMVRYINLENLDLEETEESGFDAILDYDGLYAAVLALAEKQQTAE